MRSAICIVLCAVACVKPAIGGEAAAEGTWADEDRQHIYSFLENDRLTYWSKTKWHTDPTTSYVRREATWQSKEPLCWLGKRSGNIMIYADDQKCCLAVRAEGDKLIVSNVWGEPLGVCENRVLSRIGSLPADVGPATAERAR